MKQSGQHFFLFSSSKGYKTIVVLFSIFLSVIIISKSSFFLLLLSMLFNCDLLGKEKCIELFSKDLSKDYEIEIVYTDDKKLDQNKLFLKSRTYKTKSDRKKDQKEIPIKINIKKNSNKKNKINDDGSGIIYADSTFLVKNENNKEKTKKS